METAIDEIISEEILPLADTDRSDERDMTDKEVNYEEKSDCFEDGECLCTVDEKSFSEDESMGEENLQSGEGEDKDFSAKDNEVPRKEDTHIYSGTEDISGDEAVRVLKRELDDLRRQLSERDREFERMTRECAEFASIYPDTSLHSLPDAVWEEVKDGVPIAAAYALYEKKCALKASCAARLNEKNSSCAVGSAGISSDDSYFSPAEVRRMSQREVKQNYNKILESMRRWN